MPPAVNQTDLNKIRGITAHHHRKYPTPVTFRSEHPGLNITDHRRAQLQG